eukprot:jgi/Galph1/5081/GphlegSOOS_G3768.1
MAVCVDHETCFVVSLPNCLLEKGNVQHKRHDSLRLTTSWPCYSTNKQRICWLGRKISPTSHSLYRPEWIVSSSSSYSGDDLQVSWTDHGKADILSGNTNEEHPVLSVLRKRKEEGSLPGKRTDLYRVALCIEGGGMRGAVAAGMTAAIKHLKLENAFDVVYGSSAGAIIGAYFVSRQLPIYGTSVYYEDLCSRDFIRKRQLLYRYLQPKRAQPIPVLDLDSLIDDVIVYSKPLNWDCFWENCQLQPLRPVATSLTTLESKVLDCYQTFEELRQCLRASARVPGIAGDPVKVCGDVFADAILYEAIPLRSALKEGATHVLVLRTRPQGARIPSKAGIYERLIAVPSFKFHENFPAIQEFVLSGRHRKMYFEDIQMLKQAKLSYGSEPPYLYDLAVPKGKKQVGQLESRQDIIFKAVRDGFAVAYQELGGFTKEESERIAVSIYTDEEFFKLKQQREASRYRQTSWKRKLRFIDLFKPKRVPKKTNANVSSFLEKELFSDEFSGVWPSVFLMGFVQAPTRYSWVESCSRCSLATEKKLFCKNTNRQVLLTSRGSLKPRCKFNKREQFSGTDSPRQSPTCSLTRISEYVLLIYAILMAGGGIGAYIKTKSTASIGSGIVSGVLLGYAWYEKSLSLALVVSLVLCVVFAIRYNKTKKLMPAGVLGIISAFASVVFAIGLRG